MACIALGLVSINVSAQEISICLTKTDQFQLTNAMAKLPWQYRSEELISEDSSLYVFRQYSFLDENSAFHIRCSERFYAGATIGSDSACSVRFDYTKSEPEKIVSHDGFIPAFAIAKIQSDAIARDLYTSLAIGMEQAVFFSAQERVALTHPTTGKKISTVRLRIDCKPEVPSRNYSCVISAVK